MKARFWWAIRNWWHYPQFHQGGCRPDCFKGYYYKWMIEHKKWKSLWFCFWRDVKMITWRTYWDLRYLQPLRCNGNRGGWRTKVCDWLEDKARRYEED